MILHDKATIRRYTQAGVWGDRNLIDELRAQAARHPRRPAVQDPPDRAELLASPPVSKRWDEFEAAVDAVATRLLDAGLQKDEVVIIQMPNVWELAALYFAVCAAGGIPSPAPMQWREHELGYIAELTRARLYIAPTAFKGDDRKGLIDRLRGTHRIERWITLDEITDWAGGRADRDRLDAVSVDANDVFTLCWTSGTESMPKGTPLTHNNWFFQTRRILGLSDIRDGDRILCPAPIVNMTGVGGMLLQWLFCGGTLLLHHPLNMALFLEQLTGEGIDYTILVPAMLNLILKHRDLDRIDLSRLRSVATGSAPPSAYALREFKRRWGIEISNLWGQNEGTALVSGPDDVPEVEKRVDHLPWWGKSGIAWPSQIPEVEVRIVDEDGRAMAEPGQIGELAYRGPNLFPGYFRRPEINEQAFDGDGFFYTGDLFEILDGGFIGFFDRKKDIIIRGGFNISAAEIENLALAHPAVADAAAIAVPDDVMGEKVCLCIVPRNADEPPALAEITAWMREQGIASYKLPEHLRVTDEIPRNSIGKVVKASLRGASQPAVDPP